MAHLLAHGQDQAMCCFPVLATPYPLPGREGDPRSPLPCPEMLLQLSHPYCPTSPAQTLKNWKRVQNMFLLYFLENRWTSSSNAMPFHLDNFEKARELLLFLSCEVYALYQVRFPSYQHFLFLSLNIIIFFNYHYYYGQDVQRTCREKLTQIIHFLCAPSIFNLWC